jgi:NADP-dependent aldehyde dehydrogenase
MDDVDTIARAAAEAFEVTVRSTGAERASWLRAVAAALDSGTEELVPLAHEETGIPIDRLRGEVARTTGQLRMFADVVEEGSYLEVVIDHADPSATPPRPDLRRILRPVGPVAVFSASNFPFAFSVAGGDTASALAVGCTVVVKGHAGHPLLSRRTAQLVTEALREAGAPEGIFALVTGRDAGIALVEHPAITAASFTGSLAGGRALADRAAARPTPIPFYGELGSINPVVVTAGADAARGEALATGLGTSFQLSAGQLCTKPGVVFVPHGSRLEAALPAAVGDEAHRLLTDAITSGFSSGVAAALAIDGVEVIAGDPASHTAPVVLATDAATLSEHAETLLAEVFGPFTLLVRYTEPAEVIAAFEHLEGSLTATLHAEEGEDTAELLARMESLAGRLLFAGWPTGVAVTWSQHHGGPWPATNTQHTSVGATASRRFQRPIVYQDAPQHVLPEPLLEHNPLGIPRRVDGVRA